MPHTHRQLGGSRFVLDFVRPLDHIEECFGIKSAAPVLSNSVSSMQPPNCNTRNCPKMASSSRLFHCLLALLLTLDPLHQRCLSLACSGKHVGEKASEHLSEAMKQASRQLSDSMSKGAKEMGDAVRDLATKATQIADKLTQSLDKNVQAMANTVRDMTKELTASLDKGIKEMGETVRNVATRFTEIADKLVASLDRNVQVIAATLKDISGQLTNSVDKAVEQVGQIVQTLAGGISELAKSISVRVDSGDLSNAGAQATKNLGDAIVEVSKNWKLAVETSDLKDIGAAASKHLSEAIQNVNIKISFYADVSDRFVRMAGYFAISGGIAFTVIFIAILIALRSCRSCTVTLFKLCIAGCKRGGGNDKDDIEVEDPKKTGGRTTVQNKFVKKNHHKKWMESEDQEMDTFLEKDGRRSEADIVRSSNLRKHDSLLDCPPINPVREKFENNFFQLTVD